MKISWVSTYDRLPENDGRYLIVSDLMNTGRLYVTTAYYANDLSEYTGDKYAGFFDYDAWSLCYYEKLYTRYWAPLPAPPTERVI